MGDETHNGIYNQKKEADSKPNAVYLLGEFAVYNKAGKNITYLFSPKIKQLFILIILNTKGGRGVVSKKISTTLWPEKEIIKTKNIRGVTINHLRNIISDIDGLELTFTNDTYCFQISHNFFCDYFQITDAIQQIREHQLMPEQFLADHFELFSRGGLLQDVPEPWLDEVKVEFEELLLELLLPTIKKIYEAGEHKRALELSRVALSIDPFNDIALKYKLKSLRRFKGVDFAKKVYEEFVADYKKSLDSEYPVHFDQICK
jgi:two-component SAPR family response regulator